MTEVMEEIVAPELKGKIIALAATIQQELSDLTANSIKGPNFASNFNDVETPGAFSEIAANLGISEDKLKADLGNLLAAVRTFTSLVGPVLEKMPDSAGFDIRKIEKRLQGTTLEARLKGGNNDISAIEATVSEVVKELNNI